MSNPVGLVGVGLMGTAFAHRLRGAGLSVIGFDVDAARLNGLAAIGGEKAGSIAEVTRLGVTMWVVVFPAEKAEGVVDEIAAAARTAADGRLRTVVLSV